MKEAADVINALTSKKDTFACATAEAIAVKSFESDEWYCMFDDFAKLLDYPKSLVRNRAITILAANAQWDADDRFEGIIDEYLKHITDEKPITARQCVKSLSLIADSKPALIPRMLAALDKADLSKYKDSMSPLIKKDIALARKELEALSNAAKS